MLFNAHWRSSLSGHCTGAYFGNPRLYKHYVKGSVWHSDGCQGGPVSRSLPQSPGLYQRNGAAMACVSFSPGLFPLPWLHTGGDTHRRIWTLGGNSCGLSKGLFRSVVTTATPQALAQGPLGSIQEGAGPQRQPHPLFTFILSHDRQILMVPSAPRWAKDLEMIKKANQVLTGRTCVPQWRQTQTDNEMTSEHEVC